VGPSCGALTRAAIPLGVSPGGCGPRVQAITALGTGASHLSNRATQHLREELGGLPRRLGPVAHVEQAPVQAVAAAVAEARPALPQQPAADLDETGWREGPPRAWLWPAATTGGTGFVVRRARGGKVAQELRGERCWGGEHRSLEWG
jgi:transposase